MEDILSGHENQQALERGPKAMDPFQRTIATTVESFVSHPGLKRKEVVEALKYLASALTGVQVGDLKK